MNLTAAIQAVNANLVNQNLTTTVKLSNSTAHFDEDEITPPMNSVHDAIPDGLPVNVCPIRTMALNVCRTCEIYYNGHPTPGNIATRRRLIQRIYNVGMFTVTSPAQTTLRS